MSFNLMKKYNLGLLMCLLVLNTNIFAQEETQAITEVSASTDNINSEEYISEETPVTNVEQVAELKEQIRESVTANVKTAIRDYLKDRDSKKSRNIPDYSQLTHAPIDYINPLKQQAYPVSYSAPIANNLNSSNTISQSQPVVQNNKIFNPFEAKTVYAISYEEYQAVQAGQTKMEDVLSYKTPLPEQALYNHQETYGIMSNLYEVESYYSSPNSY